MVWLLAVSTLAYLEGFTRVYLGRHWVLDIPGGWLLGAAVLAALSAVATAAPQQAALRTARPSSDDDHDRSGE